MGVAYILDEPSIGLHQRDNDKLLKTLEHLRDLGNSVIVVEHDEDTMYAADYIVDIGPGAGRNGGQVVATGTAEQIMKCKESITGAYLSGRIKIPVPAKRRKPTGWIKVRGARENNLKNISSVSRMIKDGKTPSDIINTVFEGIEYDILDETHTEFKFNCSKERYEKIMISLGKKELQDLKNEGEPVETVCSFCGNKYVFSLNDLDGFISKATR